MINSKVIACGLALCSAQAWGVEYLSGEEKQYRYDGFSLSASLGYMGGESKEYVYNEGKLLSRLDWKMKNSAILKMEANYDVLPWLSLNASGWTTLASGSGNLDDYDWQDVNSSHYTDHSSSSVTLNEANEYDLSIRGWLLNRGNYKAGVIAGYQESRFSMIARNGTYDYAGTDDDGNYDPTLPRDRGIFPLNKPLIGYRQTFKTPYVGIIGKYAVNDFEFNGVVKYSRWVDSEDYDNHYLRSMTSKTKTNSADLWVGQVNTGYWVTPKTKVFTEATYTYYPNKHGDMEEWDPEDGHQSASGGGGIQNRNWTVMAGLQYLW